MVGGVKCIRSCLFNFGLIQCFGFCLQALVVVNCGWRRDRRTCFFVVGRPKVFLVFDLDQRLPNLATARIAWIARLNFVDAFCLARQGCALPVTGRLELGTRRNGDLRGRLAGGTRAGGGRTSGRSSGRTRPNARRPWQPNGGMLLRRGVVNYPTSPWICRCVTDE